MTIEVSPRERGVVLDGDGVVVVDMLPHLTIEVHPQLVVLHLPIEFGAFAFLHTLRLILALTFLFTVETPVFLRVVHGIPSTDQLGLIDGNGDDLGLAACQQPRANKKKQQ